MAHKEMRFVHIFFRLRPYAALALALILAACGGGEDAARLDVRILATTDLHMYLADYDYYQDRVDPGVGLVRTASLIREARAERPNTLLVDAGDLIQGSPMGDEVVARGRGQAHPAFVVMNALGYDAAAAGNHEFNYGLEFLAEATAGAAFPYLSANVYIDDGDDDPSNDETLFAPYAMLERGFVARDGTSHRLKIAVIGFLPPQIMNWDGDKLRGRVKTRDIIESAERWLPEIEARQPDLIIAVAHSGLSPARHVRGAEQAGASLAAMDGIDAVVTGHSHNVFPGPDYAGFPGADIGQGTINGKPVVMAGNFGSHLGVIDLELAHDGSAWRVAAARAEARPIAREGRAAPPDGEIAALIAPYHERTRAFMAEPVGETKVPLDTYAAFLRDEAALDLIAAAQRAYVAKALAGTDYEGLPILSAVAPFKAGGRPGPDYYTVIPAGPLSLRHVADLYVYPNTVAAVVMTGAQVREWLEMSTRVFNRIDSETASTQPLVDRRVPSYVFDILDGLSYAIDLSQPQRYGRDGEVAQPGVHRIVEMTYDGAPVTAEQRFIVATNNYRAHGGGGFPGLDGTNVVLKGTETVRQVLADYIRGQGTVAPMGNRTWRFKPLPGNPRVAYEASPQAVAALSRLPGVRHTGLDAAGFATFDIDFNALAAQN